MANAVLWGLLLFSTLQAARPGHLKWLKYNYDLSKKRSRY